MYSLWTWTVHRSCRCCCCCSFVYLFHTRVLHPPTTKPNKHHFVSHLHNQISLMVLGLGGSDAGAALHGDSAGSETKTIAVEYSRIIRCRKRVDHRRIAPSATTRQTHRFRSFGCRMKLACGQNRTNVRVCNTLAIPHIIANILWANVLSMPPHTKIFKYKMTCVFVCFDRTMS